MTIGSNHNALTPNDRGRLTRLERQVRQQDAMIRDLRAKTVPHYYTPEEAARKLRLHPATIYNEIKRGELRAVKIGRLWRISYFDFKAYLERRYGYQV